MKSKKDLRESIRKILIEKNAEKHLCLNGSFVSPESQECYDDLCDRINDATQTRNLCSMQSDARDHYNGVLKVLRRKKRRAKKFIDLVNRQMSALESEEEK